jgi:hypothetical protein
MRVCASDEISMQNKKKNEKNEIVGNNLRFNSLEKRDTSGEEKTRERFERLYGCRQSLFLKGWMNLE